jgi:hypothetical protein
LEICYKVLEKDRDRHMRDARLYKPYCELLEVYKAGSAAEGDFSERLVGLSQQLITDFKAHYGTARDQRLTATDVTELVHKNSIRDIRDTLSAYLEFKDSVWVLFDNLDKGWSAHGLTAGDVLILRCLIDAARKIQRELQGDGHDFHCVVFVRNDVYQLLVEASADYGKESRAVIDWTDADLLREVLRRRLIRNVPLGDTPFARVWSQICVSHYHGEETSQYLIDRSLMRPRNLIKLLAHCRGFAVGLGRARIEEVDLEKGLRAYSIDLITEADQELTDIIGAETDLIYYFIDEGQEFELRKLESILSGAGVPAEKIDNVIQFMLYYGFLGVKTEDQIPRYIFELGYDMKLLSTVAMKAKGNLIYILNPAFHPGLNL